MFFINMQAHYDAEVAREQLAAESAIINCIARRPVADPLARQWSLRRGGEDRMVITMGVAEIVGDDET